MQDFDVYDLSERERRLVYTALDLYREAAEKQLEANQKKVRIHSKEIGDVLDVLNGDDLRWGLLHKFLPRESRERIEQEREDEQRKEREKRAQLGIFADDVEQQTIDEALDGIEEEVARQRAPQYENTPDLCSHTEILDETEEGGAPRFRCTLCGQEIAALAAPAGDSGDDVGEADYEIVDERSEEERAQDPPPQPFEPIPMIPTLEDLDALTLEDLGVPTRARNVLARRGIRTAADYLAAGDAVLRMPGVGDITLDEINGALRARGLTAKRAKEIEAQLVAAGRAFAGSMSGGATEEAAEAPAGSIYDRVLSVTCPTCSASNGIGAGEICVTVGGNPRDSFHAVRVREAVRVGAILSDEYDAAYMLKTAAGTAEEEEPEAVQEDEDTLPWEQVGAAFGNGRPGPEEIIVLEPGDWPMGAPEEGQRVHDMSGRRSEVEVGAVSDRFVLLVHSDGSPVGSLRLEHIRWSPTLGCWAWGAPAAAAVGQ